MNIPTVEIPDVIAYFNVFVPSQPNTREDTTRIVERYLYSDFAVVDVRYSDPEEGEPWDCYRVKVHGAFYGSSRAHNLVIQQRDRLSSGLYASSEPVFFGRKEV